MKALITTTNALLLADLHKKTISILESHRPEYYGVSWFPDGKELILSHSGIENDSLIELQDYALSEKGYISAGTQIINLFLSQPHQITCAPNGWIVATNTGRNSVLVYDPQTGFHKELRVNNMVWDRLSKTEFSGEHFNSVFIKNDRLYVLAHAFTKTAYVLEYDFPGCKLLNKHMSHSLSGLHNIWVTENNEFISCHSSTGSLVELKSNTMLWRSSCPSYLRGLAASQDIILAGSSEHNERHNRRQSESELWVIDRHSFATLDCIQLGAHGAVHEVRIIDTPDFAHLGNTFNYLQDPVEQTELKPNARGMMRLQKSKLSQQHKDKFDQFDYIIRGLEINEQEWLKPLDDGFALALLKEKFTRNYQASINYDFTSPGKDEPRHLSIVVGYKGASDNNMFAILLENYADHTSSNVKN